MPTYEYRCRACGYYFEKFQSMTAAREKFCPVCGAEIERLLGPGAGFIMKGSAALQSEPSHCGHAQPCCGRSERCGDSACRHES